MNDSNKKCPDFAKLIQEQPADEELFQLVVNCFSNWLSMVARHTCRNDNLADDAFQDAMIAVQKNLSGYRGDAPIEPWLRKIVFSSCSRLRRGKKNDPRVNVMTDPLEIGAQGASGEPMSQEDHLLLQEKFGQLLLVVNKLEEPNRSLLMFHDSGEKSISELAAQYDMTEEAVKSRLKRTRATVRSHLLDLAS